MDWLERYASAVKNYLPRKTREDVGEEILSTLRDKREGREEELGRALTEAELKDWIGAMPHPMVYAAGYQERRELVPAEIYPHYLYALKIALVILIAIKVFSAGLYVLDGNDLNFSGVWVRLFGGLVEQGLLAFASVTLVFHFLGGSIAKAKLFQNWSVRDLPAGDHKWMRASVGETIFEIVAYLFALAFVNRFFAGSFSPEWAELNPGFYALVPWVNAILVLSIAHGLWLVARPTWTAPKLLASAGLAILTLWVVGQALGLSPYVTFDPAFVTDHPGIARGDWLNNMVRVSLYVVGAICLGEVGRDAYRLYKLKM